MLPEETFCMAPWFRVRIYMIDFYKLGAKIIL
jgi:hypothetical protein